MNCLLRLYLAPAGALLACAAMAAAQVVVSETPSAGSVRLSAASDVVFSPGQPELTGIAAQDLADDIGRTGGAAAHAVNQSSARTQVWAGIAGQDANIDALARSGKLDTSRLANCWECFLIATVEAPRRGVDRALVIAGSDRRGAAFGVYEVSRAIGVSAWHWWADVAPLRKKAIFATASAPVFSRPSVKFRGIFINDEDWGLFRWVRDTFDPETGNFGPKTYEKVFQLMLRLKANTLWPAMHAVSRAFNSNPENARLADRYGIVMSASHAEPMLRDNLAEWKDAPDRFNFLTNPEGVLQYWEERVKANGKFENVYPLGIRGIHDSQMLGPKTLEERQSTLNSVIADQRELIRKYVGPPDSAPQIFVPYKEVLDVYNAGIPLPSDVTLVWPDDNFGYIRHFSGAAERERTGHSGVYYHLSYLGAPLSYLWLSTTPPALIAEEMGRAFDHGADRFWMFNVGDIKPAEVDLSLAMDLAWNAADKRARSQKDALEQLAAELFGASHGKVIGDIWDRYYRLNFERRPEHLQYYLPREKPHDSGLSAQQAQERLGAFQKLGEDTAAAAASMGREQADGFFELVGYPVLASALANQRFFWLEAYQRLAESAPEDAALYAGSAREADTRLKELTRRYNSAKWHGVLAEEPADDDWKSFRIAAAALPPEAASKSGRLPASKAPDDGTIRVDAGAFPAPGWTKIEGLASGHGSMRAVTGGASLTATVSAPKAGAWCVTVKILPTFPGDNRRQWGVGVTVDQGELHRLTYTHEPSGPAWTQGVLNNFLAARFPMTLAAGSHTLRFVSDQAELILNGFELKAGEPSACH